jgi:hypothetical protein
MELFNSVSLHYLLTANLRWFGKKKVFMKSLTKLLILSVVLMLSLSSCSKDDSAVPETVLSNIELSITKTTTSVSLSWIPVSGCSWYRIYIAKNGEPLVQVANYQDLINIPITYTIYELTANTSYNIKIEGRDYASGGKILASKTLVVSTNP